MESVLSIKERSEKEKKRLNRKRTWGRIKENKALYAMIFPGVLYFIIFKYIPMGGLVIAFQDYQPFLGILGSPSVGLEHFARLFSTNDFMMLLKNTLALFLWSLCLSFPTPIILALLLNEVRHNKFKKFVQTVTYLPNFLSMVIVVSIFYMLLTTEGGVVNNILNSLGMKSIPFLTSEKWLRPVYILQDVWKGTGWGSIVYIAAITNVDESLYEAAEMDGAGKLKKMWHITLPSIRPTIITLLILKIGSILDLGFEHMFLLMNSLNKEVAQIFDTYVYTQGIINGQLSYSTAVGMFKGVVGFILVIGANKLANKVGEEGLY